jgi:hypothetical protein
LTVSVLDPKNVKERGIFAGFTIKDRLNFPVLTHYHVGGITHANRLAGKFNAD